MESQYQAGSTVLSVSLSPPPSTSAVQNLTPVQFAACPPMHPPPHLPLDREASCALLSMAGSAHPLPSALHHAFPLLCVSAALVLALNL